MWILRDICKLSEVFLRIFGGVVFLGNFHGYQTLISKEFLRLSYELSKGFVVTTSRVFLRTFLKKFLKNCRVFN